MSQLLAMVDKKRLKYMSKSVRFGDSELTLYSIDGVTWSTRRDELVAIIERHEAEKLKVTQAIRNEGEAVAVEEAADSADKSEDADAANTKYTPGPSNKNRKGAPASIVAKQKLGAKPAGNIPAGKSKLPTTKTPKSSKSTKPVVVSPKNRAGSKPQKNSGKSKKKAA